MSEDEDHGPPDIVYWIPVFIAFMPFGMLCFALWSRMWENLVMKDMVANGNKVAAETSRWRKQERRGSKNRIYYSYGCTLEFITQDNLKRVSMDWFDTDQSEYDGRFDGHCKEPFYITYDPNKLKRFRSTKHVEAIAEKNVIEWMIFDRDYFVIPSLIFINIMFSFVMIPIFTPSTQIIVLYICEPILFVLIGLFQARPEPADRVPYFLNLDAVIRDNDGSKTHGKTMNNHSSGGETDGLLSNTGTTTHSTVTATAPMTYGSMAGGETNEYAGSAPTGLPPAYAEA